MLRKRHFSLYVLASNLGFFCSRSHAAVLFLKWLSLCFSFSNYHQKTGKISKTKIQRSSFPFFRFISGPGTREAWLARISKSNLNNDRLLTFLIFLSHFFPKMRFVLAEIQNGQFQSWYDDPYAKCQIVGPEHGLLEFYLATTRCRLLETVLLPTSNYLRWFFAVWFRGCGNHRRKNYVMRSNASQSIHYSLKLTKSFPCAILDFES